MSNFLQISLHKFGLLFSLFLMCTQVLKAQVVSFSVSSADSTFSSQFVFVKGGTFLMGNATQSTDEQQEHWVRLNDFYIGRYEVTQKEWECIMGTNPSGKKGGNLPVESVNFEDVQLFIARLNATRDGHFRLPTEAEWEYASRGGRNGKGYLYAGSDSIREVAWYGKSIRYNAGDSLTGSQPVGRKLPNELGIYDMSGNVAEWCSDWYAPDYYKTSPRKNPAGPESGEKRVIRGGCWYNDAYFCQVYSRFSAFPGDADEHLGFRLVYIPSSIK